MVYPSHHMIAKKPQKPGSIGSFCTENDDCSDSSFCCSKSRCDIGFVCATGLKLEGDSCEFKYECASRCCQSKNCAEQKLCYQNCKSNSDCLYSTCCSHGHCSQDIVCQGNKGIGDSCDVNSECITRLCKQYQCVTASQDDWKKQILDNVIRVVAILIIIIAIILWCQNKRQQQRNQNFSDQQVEYRAPEYNNRRNQVSGEASIRSESQASISQDDSNDENPLLLKLQTGIKRGFHFNDNKALKLNQHLSGSNEYDELEKIKQINQGANLSRIDENSFDESEDINFGIGSKVDLDSDADKKSGRDVSIRKFSKDIGEISAPKSQRNDPTLSFKAVSVKNGKTPIDLTAIRGTTEEDITITPRETSIL